MEPVSRQEQRIRESAAKRSKGSYVTMSELYLKTQQITHPLRWWCFDCMIELRFASLQLDQLLLRGASQKPPHIQDRLLWTQKSLRQTFQKVVLGACSNFQSSLPRAHQSVNKSIEECILLREACLFEESDLPAFNQQPCLVAIVPQLWIVLNQLFQYGQLACGQDELNRTAQWVYEKVTDDGEKLGKRWAENGNSIQVASVDATAPLRKRSSHDGASLYTHHVATLAPSLAHWEHSPLEVINSYGRLPSHVPHVEDVRATLQCFTNRQAKQFRFHGKWWRVQSHTHQHLAD